MSTSRTGTGTWKRTRNSVITKGRAQHLPCASCRQPIAYDTSGQPNSPEVDHIIPVKRGGTNARENLQILCRTCNRSKGSKDNTPTPAPVAERFPWSRQW